VPVELRRQLINWLKLYHLVYSVTASLGYTESAPCLPNFIFRWKIWWPNWFFWSGKL